MNVLSILRCPLSGEILQRLDELTLVTNSGSKKYAVVADIPDLRVFDPPYVTRQEEADRVERLHEASAQLDYEGLVRFYETKVLASRPRAQIEKGIAHRLHIFLSR